MEWLTRLPWIGPWIARAMRTHAWRAFEHAQDVQWSRLAAAITFTSFIAMFPLIALGAAIGAALLTTDQLDSVIHKVNQQIPGLAQQVNIAGLAANAGTVGVIAGVLLLLTGINWIAQLRGCLRAVWDLAPDHDNPVLRKVLDAGVLAGLGGVGLASLACSAFATSAVGWVADRIGLEGRPGSVLLTVAGFCVAVLTDFLLLTYLLTLLPGVRPARRAVVEAGLLGAVGLEVLKVILSSYLQRVAGRSLYGAFGTPVALLLWINFMARLLLYCAAWTVTHPGEREVRGADAGGSPRGSASDAVPPAKPPPAPPAPRP
jgi:membrane protein